MTRAGFVEIERLWQQVADADPAERARILATADDDTRREVESLLAAEARAGDFLDQPAAPLLADGTRFGAYEIVAPIAAGGMGEVYRARDSRLGRELAIKILAPQLWDSASAAARFAREARAASALNHPNIVQIYEIDVATIGGASIDYIAMELVDGETLRDAMARGAGLAFVVEALGGAARALARAHDAGIVHRDLKPENIMVTRDGTAKVLDFGLAKVSAAPTSAVATRSGVVMGTVGYMSPEQAQGERIDGRSDVFAIGCILFEAATGRRPFESESLVDTLHRIVHAPVPPLRQANPSAPRRLQRIVERCLEKKPEARYASMRDLAAALDELPQRGDASSLAILPFSTSSAADRYLGDGVADAVGERLQRVASLRVVPSDVARLVRTASLRDRFRVAAIIGGRIERNGSRIAVTATMTDATSGDMRWQQRFERAADEAPSLERDVARGIASALSLSISDAEDRALVRADTNSPRAYDAFLRGRFEWNRWTYDGWKRAIGEFRQALVADPLFANAYAGLSDSYAQLALYVFDSPRENWIAAKAAALKAVALDPNLGEAHMSLGVVHTWYDWDFAAAEREYRAAIALSPRSPEAHLAYAFHLDVVGRSAEGVREAERAVALNPVSYITNMALADSLMIVGDRQRFIDQAKHLAEMNPEVPGSAGRYGLALALAGRESEAWPYLHESDRGDGVRPERLAVLEQAYARGGLRAYWRELARQDEQTGEQPWELADEYALAGDRDDALRMLQKGVQRHDAFVLWAKSYPSFAPLHGDPRYEALLRQMGF